MEKTILEKNLEQISRYNEKLAKKIAELNQIKNSFELLEAKSGDVNLLYNGVLLHDNIDPQEEAYNIFRSLSDNSKSSVNVLFGLGLGYVFKRFALSGKGKIIILEPNLDILRITLEIVDMSEDLSKDGILIVDSISDLEKYFEKVYFADAEVNFKLLDSYTLLNPEILGELKQRIEFIKGLYASNYNNLFLKCLDWTISGINNIPEVLEHNEVESLRDKFAGKPAVIISAGPSLDKNIDILKAYQDKAVIFCVGTALKTAVKHSIEPDFLTIVENNDCSGQVLGVNTSDMNMILMPFTHNKFHNLNTKRKFNFYPKNDFTTLWLAKHLGISLDDYYNKGTVSLCALFSAAIMGCSPIILIGQDLAYSGGKCYSSDSPYSALKCVKDEMTGKYKAEVDDMDAFIKHYIPADAYTNPIFTSITNFVDEIVNSKLVQLNETLTFVKGQNDEILPTEAGYAIFISYFEQAARELGDKKKFINSTEGGAYLEGFNHISLKESLERHARVSINKEEIISKALSSGRDLLKTKGDIILREVDKTIDLFENNLDYFEQGKLYSTKLNKELTNNRINSEYFKEHCQHVLSSYIAIEENILTQNELILGLLYPQYSRLSNYLSTYNENLDQDSIKKFVALTYDYFINGYANLLSKMAVIKAMREKLNESCNSACK